MSVQRQFERHGIHHRIYHVGVGHAGVGRKSRRSYERHIIFREKISDKCEMLLHATKGWRVVRLH